MGTVTIQGQTTRYPYELIGMEAGICYGADTKNDEKNRRRGIECLKNNHGRTLEFVQVFMILDGYSARVMREFYTHIGGAPTRLQSSTRYIDYTSFDYYTPDSILYNDAAKHEYDKAMKFLSGTATMLEGLDIPREDIANLLPLGMTTTVVVRTNLRNLIDMSHQRLCTRALKEYRGLMYDIMKALCDYSNEWEDIINHCFVPKCDLLGYCPEKNGCGRHPKKENE